MTSRPITQEQLLAFAAGDLAAADAERVRDHLAASPEAARIVALYQLTARRVREDDGVEPPAPLVVRAKALFRAPATAGFDWIGHLERLVARLVYDSRLQPAPVRAVETGERVQLAFEQGDVSIDVHAQRQDDEGGRWRLVVQVETEGGVTASAVALVDETERAVAGGPVDADGMAIIEAAPGAYALHVRCGDASIVLPGVKFP